MNEGILEIGFRVWQFWKHNIVELYGRVVRSDMRTSFHNHERGCVKTAI